MTIKLNILFDGWSLVHAPNSPAALHLIALLEHLPSQALALVALPGEARFPLPARAQAVIAPAAQTGFARLLWEQRTLPRLARRHAAQALHMLSEHAPLVSGVPVVISPTSTPRDPHLPAGCLASRLRDAFGQGGRSRASRIGWPSDLPDPSLDRPIWRLPPCVPKAFGVMEINATEFGTNGGGNHREARLDLPERYVLYHGPQDVLSLRRLATAWSRAADPLDEFTLLVVGFSAAGQSQLGAILQEYATEVQVRTVPALPMDQLAAVYRGCAALFHPADLPAWGDPLRLALACARPVVGLETPRADAIAGPAAYLAPLENDEQATARLLAAALITVIGEESVAEGLVEAARVRAAAWERENCGEALVRGYEGLAV